MGGECCVASGECDDAVGADDDDVADENGRLQSVSFFVRHITIDNDLVWPDPFGLNRWPAGFNLGDFPLLIKLVRTSSAMFMVNCKSGQK